MVEGSGPTSTLTLTIGVLALQGAFVEHVKLLRQAERDLRSQISSSSDPARNSNNDDEHPSGDVRQPLQRLPHVELLTQEVRTPAELSRCDALIIPGGESTSISLIAERTGLLEPLREFVKVRRRPTWGTCAGLILLAESANKSKSTGQELIGGLDVRVRRNYFGRQTESFEAELGLSPFLAAAASSSEGGDEGGGEVKPFHSVFIRAPVVEKILPSTPVVVDQTTGDDDDAAGDATVTAPPRKATNAPVEILARLPGRARALRDATTTAQELGEEGDIVAVRQGNVFGTAFHPELTGDGRIHGWWLGEVLKAKIAEADLR